MPFRNTHTPRRSEVEGKHLYQCPKSLRGGQSAYYLTPELEERFRKLYPVTMNRDMMRLFGISFSTMQRFKRQLGLEKKMRTIRHKQAQLTKKICEENGYYDSIRGHAPSDAAIEATKQMWRDGFHPMKALRKKNPRKYKRTCQRWSEQRTELMRKERLRVNWGLDQETNLRIPYDPYNKKRTSFRNTCKQVGYIPGNARIHEERWIIYYDDNTRRGAIRERNGQKLGFKFMPLPNDNQQTLF